jgi:hypothetical protein
MGASVRTEQTSFLPEKTTDQRVVAVYFDKSRRVQRRQAASYNAP